MGSDPSEMIAELDKVLKKNKTYNDEIEIDFCLTIMMEFYKILKNKTTLVKKRKTLINEKIWFCVSLNVGE